MKGGLYEFAKAAVYIFFISFTVLGVAGFLPGDLQADLNSHPVFAIGSLSNVAALQDTAPGSPDPSANSSSDPSASSLLASAVFAPIKYTPQGEKEYPVHISIPAIGVNASVSNPKSTDNTVLDNDLSSGAVRYPTSGALNDGGNVFLFGHSSYLKVIHNQAYKTFDGLQNLQKGDEIEVDGPQNAYIYLVTSVSLLKDSDAVVNVGGNDHELILSTCDIFGAKEDRYIVTAEFSQSFPLTNS